MTLRERLHRMVSLEADKAPEHETIESIEGGVDFHGPKLWILVLAIFVASLGLNTNSTAVIIGAMLISPLMGPIIGMGLGIGTNNFQLLKRAFRSYAVATVFSVATATIYFLITPFNEAQSELLARTSPTIYDVCIALCGGLAGIIALSSRSQRSGNVIPGVAIATALMPPLCTVGFGLATANWLYAAGALYLYLINTIFISLATFVGVKFLLRFHKKAFVDKAREKRVTRTITTIAFITILPSLFITFTMLQQTVFEQRCQQFCRNVLPEDAKTHIIKQSYDYSGRTIQLVMLGEELDSTAIAGMRTRLADYSLENVHLEVLQSRNGMDASLLQQLLDDKDHSHEIDRQLLDEEKRRIETLEEGIAPYNAANQMASTLLPEVQALYPAVHSVTVAEGRCAFQNDSLQADSAQLVVCIATATAIPVKEQPRLQEWVQQRTGRQCLVMIQQQK